jgi:hypothetical protein
MRPKHLLLRLREGRSAHLAVRAHCIVESEAVCGLRHAMSIHVVRRLLPALGAIAMMMLGYLRGIMAQLVDVDGIGQIGQLLAIGRRPTVRIIANVEVEVEMVEIDQVPEVVLRCRVHGLELLRCGPRLSVHCAHCAAKALPQESAGEGSVYPSHLIVMVVGRAQQANRRTGARRPDSSVCRYFARQTLAPR